MNIILIQPLVRKMEQKAMIIIEDGDVLRTVFIDVNDKEVVAKLNKAIKTGKYPEIKAINVKNNVSIYLKFKK